MALQPEGETLNSRLRGDQWKGYVGGLNGTCVMEGADAF